MNFIKLDEEFNSETFDFSGEEAKLYIMGNDLYKIYKKNNISSIYHLCILMAKQKDLQETILPNGIVLKDDELRGIKILYFKDYKTVSSLSNINDNYKLTILQTIMRNLKELTDNDIYPMDFNSDGILVHEEDVKIVDLDTYTTQVIKNASKESLLFVLKLYRNIIFELMYSDFDPITVLPNLSSYLENKKVHEKIIIDIASKELSYHNLSNYIEWMKNK